MNSNASWKSTGDGVSGQFPAGLRVLVVDDDPTCLRILEKMLKNCLYEVTTSNRAELALQFLRDNRNGYDIVISDVHMPDMDGFKLLEHVGLEMDLPVIMMSADDSKNVVMKGVTHGACDYLIKPVRMEALKNIWQHVVRRKKHEWKDKDFEQSGSADEQQRPATEDLDYSSSANEGNWRSRSSKRRKEEEEDEAEERDDTSTLKKPRVVWSIELHQQFVTAVNQLGIDKAVPKKILELMNVPGLTRENVASHLQKYRLYLRRLSGVPHHQNGLGNSFMGPADSPFGHLASLNGVDLQALAASGQLPPHSLATIQAAALGRAAPRPTIPDQRNIFAYETKTPRLVEEQQHKHDNAKFLHGIPTNMDSKKLATLRQNGLGGMSTGQSNSLLINHVGQPVLARRRIDNVSGAQYASIPQPSTTVDFSSRSTDFLGNSYSFVGTSSVTSKLQDEANAETKASRGYVPNYDVFNELNRDRTPEWRCANVGSTIEQPQHSNVRGGLDVSPSVSIQNRFSSNGQNRVPQPVHHSSVSDNPSRIKAESFPYRSFRNTPFPQRFGQDELMSAILKQQEGMGPVENEFSFDGYHLDNLPV